MSTRRERFFRCCLKAAQGCEESILQASTLQAWDADGAAAAFREELALAGLPCAGRVEVEDLTGQLARRGASIRQAGLPGAAAGV